MSEMVPVQSLIDHIKSAMDVDPWAKEMAEELLKEREDLGEELTNAVELIRKKNKRIEKLLKEQEAVSPERESSGGGITWWNVCGACRVAINPNDKYCHECGRPVKRL